MAIFRGWDVKQHFTTAGLHFTSISVLCFLRVTGDIYREIMSASVNAVRVQGGTLMIEEKRGAVELAQTR